MKSTQTKRIKRPVHGVLLLDKPYGMSSNQALQKCRWLLQAEKGGHTGVLDPLATGLLPLCFGEATKFAQRMLDADKRYTATMQLGVTTTTGDLEGEVLLTRPVNVSLEQIEAVLVTLRGDIQQTPPMYSALKHEGKPLYEYARAGIHIERPSRSITIYALDIVSFSGDQLVIDVSCSKGTYIRTLSESIGELLGCGAHLLALRRTATAGFSLSDAQQIDAFEAMPQAARESVLMAPDSLVVDLPQCHLDLAQTNRLIYGMSVRLPENNATIKDLRIYGNTGSAVNVFLGLGELIDGLLYPRRLLSTVVPR